MSAGLGPKELEENCAKTSWCLRQPSPQNRASSRGAPSSSPCHAADDAPTPKMVGLSLPVSAATGAPALSAPSGPSRSTAEGRAPLQSCSRLEKLSQAARCQALAGVQRSEAGSPRPRLPAAVGEAEEHPQPAQHSGGRRPEGLGARGAAARGPGRPQARSSSRKRQRGPGAQRREGAAPVRRRTPPACWASGRPRRWLAWAPPGSSCPRPSSSSGTA